MGSKGQSLQDYLIVEVAVWASQADSESVAFRAIVRQTHKPAGRSAHDVFRDRDPDQS